MRIKLDGLDISDIEHLPILADAHPSRALQAVEKAEIGLFQNYGGAPNPREVFDKTLYVAGRYKYKDAGWNIIASIERNRATGVVFCESHLHLRFIGSYRITKRYKTLRKGAN